MKNNYKYKTSQLSSSSETEREIKKLDNFAERYGVLSNKIYLRMKDLILILSVSVICYLYVFFRISNDEIYIEHLDKAIKLNDTYSINNLNVISSTAISLVFMVILFLSLGLFFSFDFKSKQKLEYEEAREQLERQKSGDLISSKLINLCFFDTRKISKIMTFFFCFFAFLITGFAGSYPGTEIIEEVSLNTEVNSVHLESGNYTVLYRDGDELKSLLIPSSVNTKILFNDNDGFIARAEVYFLKHESYHYQILPLSKRSVDYKAIITIPSDFKIEGTRKY